MGFFGMTQVSAGVVVIVHPKNPVNEMDAETVQKIFLGKAKSFPSGEIVLPLDQKEDNPLKQAFYENVVNKPLTQLKAYWSKLIFTGKGQPPRAVPSEEIVDLIARNPNMIAYVNEDQVTDQVKIVFRP
jgi:ABC-type phosphate transport system substrate-binding protein